MAKFIDLKQGLHRTKGYIQIEWVDYNNVHSL
jgi:hypothetical protein